MKKTGLSLPIREQKPRSTGLNILIDNGSSLWRFEDIVESFYEYIDFVKFGWGTSIISKPLKEKINCLQKHQIPYFFGGTLFEKYLSQNKVEDFVDYCKHYNCKYIEVSNGTISITNRIKASYIRDLSNEFVVFSEVGNKDVVKAEKESSDQWIEYIEEDLEAGAYKVITEARESGTSGICGENGEVREEIFTQLQESSLPLERLIFEAPTKKLQTYFIQQVGANVNLANIALEDIISLETLRLGLRSDTFHLERHELKI